MELVSKDETDEGMHVSIISRGVSGSGQYSGDKVMYVLFLLFKTRRRADRVGRLLNS